MRQYNHRVFRGVNQKNGVGFNVICYTEDKRNGFRHVAIVEGLEGIKASASYSNRTWEEFVYQSVLRQLIQKFNDVMDGDFQIKGIES